MEQVEIITTLIFVFLIGMGLGFYLARLFFLG